MYKHIDHVALAVNDIQRAADFYRDVFQLDLIMGLSYPPDGVHTNLVFSLGPDNELELMGPLGNNGFLVEFLDRHGQGFHHLAIEVTDIERKTSQLEKNGIRIFGGTRHKSMQFAFLHPASTLRVGMQLVQRKPQKTSHNSLIKGIDHVAVYVSEVERGRHFFNNQLGAEMGSSKQYNVFDCVSDRFLAGGAHFDLLYDVAGSRPANMKQGLHHLALKVDDLSRAAGHLKQFDIEPLDEWRDENSFFLPPDKMYGVLWQLIQSR